MIPSSKYFDDMTSVAIHSQARNPKGPAQRKARKNSVQIQESIRFVIPQHCVHMSTGRRAQIARQTFRFIKSKLRRTSDGMRSAYMYYPIFAESIQHAQVSCRCINNVSKRQ